MKILSALNKPLPNDIFSNSAEAQRTFKDIVDKLMVQIIEKSQDAIWTWQKNFQRKRQAPQEILSTNEEADEKARAVDEPEQEDDVVLENECSDYSSEKSDSSDDSSDKSDGDQPEQEALVEDGEGWTSVKLATKHAAFMSQK